MVRPLLRSIPGVAEINSQGGYVRQYRALVNPDRMRHYRSRCSRSTSAGAQQCQLRRRRAAALRGAVPDPRRGPVRGLDDIGSIVLKEIDGTPVYVRDVAEVKIGHEVRRGALIRTGGPRRSAAS